jgi:hypothetical protein
VTGITISESVGAVCSLLLANTEIYAGAAASDHGVLERLERDFDRVRRVLISGKIWVQHLGQLSQLDAPGKAADELGAALAPQSGIVAMRVGRLERG